VLISIKYTLVMTNIILLMTAFCIPTYADDGAGTGVSSEGQGTESGSGAGGKVRLPLVTQGRRAIQMGTAQRATQVPVHLQNHRRRQALGMDLTPAEFLHQAAVTAVRRERLMGILDRMVVSGLVRTPVRMLQKVNRSKKPARTLAIQSMMTEFRIRPLTTAHPAFPASPMVAFQGPRPSPEAMRHQTRQTQEVQVTEIRVNG